jgi:1-acyl-sn-glycerol-3-phosphate acyltransferase
VDPLAWSGAERSALPGAVSAPTETSPQLGRSIEHVLRRLGTGLLFAVFGLGSVAVACVAFPLLAIRKRGAERELAAQRLIHRSMAAFIGLGTALGLFAVRERGTERLRRGAGLVLATHPTLLDVVFLISRMPQADCIVKAEAWRNPFLHSIVSAAGYIPNTGGPSVIEACAERLRAGRSVIVFPEGTRSPAKGFGRFKRGAAHIALRSGGAVTPVWIHCEPSALRKDQPWWDMPNQKLLYTLDVGEPLSVEALTGGAREQSPGLAARAFTQALLAYFETKVADARAR